MREARAVPVPVSVPVPLMTVAATGERIAFAPLTVRLLLTARLLLSVSGWVVFESVRLLKVIDAVLLILCAPVPLKLNVPVPALKVVAGPDPPAVKVRLPAMLTVPVLPLNVAPTTGPGPIDKLPPTFIVLLFIVRVPPVTTTFVGANVLPALLVHVPSVEISMSPPMVVLVPETLTAEAVDTLLPALVAVLPEKVMLG